MHGVLLLDKPTGITSNGALQAVKRLYRAEKAGHTGTLDPFAGGLLPVCLGEATKFSQYQLEADKRYRAVLRLGVTTTTGDLEGDVLEIRDVQVEPALLDAVLARFVGPGMQTPPMYSALKFQGKPLYEYARAGITVERVARPVHIRSIGLLAYAGIELTIEVACSAGTYIRTLAEDIGAVLGCGAHLTQLTRLSSGGFQLADAVGLDQLAADEDARRDARLSSPDALVGYLPSIEVGPVQAQALLRGQQPRFELAGSVSGLMRVYCHTLFLGLVDVRNDGAMIAQRMMRPDSLMERL
ncbi:MAG: tRNA pseudouridine(55) synthase TruB [Burkholderiales bacterium]